MPYISNPPRANIIYANGFGSELATDLLPETSCSPPLSPSPPVTPFFSAQGLELVTVSAKQKTSLADESLSRSGAAGAFPRKPDTSQQPPPRAAPSLRGGRAAADPGWPEASSAAAWPGGGGAAPGCEEPISCKGRDQILAFELKAAFRGFGVS